MLTLTEGAREQCSSPCRRPELSRPASRLGTRGRPVQAGSTFPYLGLRCTGTEGEALAPSGRSLRDECWFCTFDQRKGPGCARSTRAGASSCSRCPRSFCLTRRRRAAISRVPNRLQVPGATAAPGRCHVAAVGSGGGVASGSFLAHAQPPRVLTTTTRASSAPRPGGHPPLGGADWASCMRTGVPLARSGMPAGDVIKTRQTRRLPGGE